MQTNALHDTALPQAGRSDPVAARRLFFQLVLCLGIVYLAFFSGHYSMGDNHYRISWAKALWDHHSNDISAYEPDTKYCKYGIGQSLLHIPFILVARGIKQVTHLSCEGPVNMLLYVLNGALGGALAGLILRDHGINERAAFWRALLIGVASVWFPYAKVEYGESLVTTLVLATWFLGPRLPIAAGLLAGIAVTVRMDALLWTLPTILLTVATWRYKFRSLAALVPGIVVTVWSNYARTGSLFSSGYEPGFIHNPVFGLYGELFSFGKSIFLFSPLLLLYPFVIRGVYQAAPTRRLALWSGVLLAGQLLLYARWWDWSGDDAWGPRFLVVSTMAGQVALMAWPALVGTSFRVLAGAGLALQLLAVLMGPHATLMLNRTRHPQKFTCGMVTATPINIEDVHFVPAFAQVTATAELFIFKVAGVQCRSANQDLMGSTWIESFSPPLRRDEIAWDIFWLNLRTLRHGASGGAPAVTTPTVPPQPARTENGRGAYRGSSGPYTKTIVTGPNVLYSYP